MPAQAKSSTIKAVANALQEEGLRLIEVKKNQLFRLPLSAGAACGKSVEIHYFLLMI